MPPEASVSALPLSSRTDLAISSTAHVSSRMMSARHASALQPRVGRDFDLDAEGVRRPAGAWAMICASDSPRERPAAMWLSLIKNAIARLKR